MEVTLQVNIPLNSRQSLATLLFPVLEGRRVVIDRNLSGRNMVRGFVRRVVSPDSGRPDYFKFYIVGSSDEFLVHTKNDTITILE